MTLAYNILIQAGFPQRIPGFIARAVYVRFVVDKEALGQVSLRLRRMSPACIILRLLHIPSCACVRINCPISDRCSADI